MQTCMLAAARLHSKQPQLGSQETAGYEIEHLRRREGSRREREGVAATAASYKSQRHAPRWK